jgi:hypothetical protein
MYKKHFISMSIQETSDTIIEGKVGKLSIYSQKNGKEMKSCQTIEIYPDRQSTELEKKYTIHCYGEQVNQLILKISLPCVDLPWIGDIGDHMIKKITVMIGKQVIYQYDKDYMNIHNYLSKTYDRFKSHKRVMEKNADGTVFIPLDILGVLPMCRVRYQCVVMYVEFADIKTLIMDTNDLMPSIFLQSTVLASHVTDPDERATQDDKKHIVIETVQYEEFMMNGINNMMRINLKIPHPCKKLIWVCVPVEPDAGCFEYLDMIARTKISIHGYPVIDQQSDFFTKTQQYLHDVLPIDNVHMYVFRNDPSGAFDLSHCDVKMEFGIQYDATYHKPCKLKIYAVCHRVLSTCDGMSILM